MTLNLKDLINGGETYTVEFKIDVNDDDLVEAAACLANGDGGWLLLGVGDDGTVLGARPRHGVVTDSRKLEALIANKTSPALPVQVKVEPLNNRDVVAVCVPKSPSVVATSSGRYVRRAIGTDGKPQCLPMLPHEVQSRITVMGGRDLTTMPLAELSIAELDQGELDRFRNLARNDGDPVLAHLSNPDLLSALGLRTIDGLPTVGAALLFGTLDVLRAFAPTHAVAFQALDEHDAIKTNRSLDVPLLRAMVELAEAVEPHNPEEEIDDGLFRVGLPL